SVPMAPTTALRTNNSGSQTANTMIQRLRKQNRATAASTGGPAKFEATTSHRRRLPQLANLVAEVTADTVTFDSRRGCGRDEHQTSTDSGSHAGTDSWRSTAWMRGRMRSSHFGIHQLRSPSSSIVA